MTGQGEGKLDRGLEARTLVGQGQDIGGRRKSDRKIGERRVVCHYHGITPRSQGAGRLLQK
ncbi:unnamed protein product [Diplocarpon coronariae]